MAALTTREAVERGLTRGNLRSQRFDHLAHGLWADERLLGVKRLRALRRVLPDEAVVDGASACEVWGLPRLGVITPEPQFVVPAPRHPSQHSRVRCGVMSLTDDDVVEVDGLRVLAPGRLFVESATRLAPADLVALGDAMLRRELVRLPDLADVVARSGRRRGILTARWAVPLLDPRVDSVPETRIRLLVVLAGLPRPECNVDLYDDHGRWVGRPDLLFEAYHVGVEHDGAHHYTVEQGRKDVVRNEDIRDAGTDLVIVNAIHLRHPQLCLDRIYRRLVANGLPPLPSRPSAVPYLAALRPLRPRCPPAR